MRRLFWPAAMGLLMCMWVAGSAAEVGAASNSAKGQVKAMDAQVQNLKEQVLDIAGALIQLEEQLIYSPENQLSIFVSVVQGDQFSFDALKIKIDGAEAAHHDYLAGEIEAFQYGGVHRIYTGNVRAGEHVIEVSMIDKSTSSNENQQTAEYKFTKDSHNRLIEITLAEPGSGKRISFRE